MAVRTLRDLAPQPARDFIESEAGSKLVQVVGRCEIRYEGRAQSTLERGDRLLVMKPDGTFLAHTDEKLKPVNWQPPGSSFQAAVDDEDRLVVTASRSEPREVVRVTVDEIQMVQSMDLADDGELDLVGTEDDLQELLYERPDLVEEGFTFWSRERTSGRGPMDLYGEDAEGNRVVVEVKRTTAGVAEVQQLRRYVEREEEARGADVRGLLFAPDVSDKARRFLSDLGLEYREADWDELLPEIQSVLPANQSTLGEWDDG
jgi:RecB family endonuclease NucS